MSAARLTRNFTRDEMACPHCGRAGADYILMLMLEQLRAAVAVTVPEDPALHISSGFRCDEHNRKVGGLDDSFHKEGRAADIWHRTLSVSQLYDTALSLWAEQFGLGRYLDNGFIHIDSGPYLHPKRATVRRWDG